MFDRDVEVPGGQVRVRVVGDAQAPLVLCVHGLSANLTGFSWLVEGLVTSGLRVAAIDVRGRGRSPAGPPGSLGPEAHARDALAVADALGAERFVYVGWSMGALIGMHAARLAPERVASLVLLDLAGEIDQGPLELIEAGLARLDLVVERPEDYTAVIRDRGLITPWTPFWEEHFRYELGPQREDGSWSPSTDRAACLEDLGALHQDWPTLWSALTMPVMLVATDDPIGDGLIVPPATRQAIAAAVPHLQLLETPRNHYTVMTDPLALAALAAAVSV